MTRATVLGLRLRFARPALYAILVLDLIALGAFAIRVETVTRTTTTPAARQAAAVGPAAPVVAPLPVTLPGGSVPTPAADPRPVDDPPAPAPRPEAPTPTPTAAPTAGPAEPSVRIARCPVAIKEPETNGGLQSLIDFAPAFGPFSAEAFAAASAYQPLLQVIGPVLAQYPKYADRLQPVLEPLLAVWQEALNTGFAVLGPLYAPYRTQVLQAEADLATALTPYAEELAGSPLAGCLVELQDALLEGPA